MNKKTFILSLIMISLSSCGFFTGTNKDSEKISQKEKIRPDTSSDENPEFSPPTVPGEQKFSPFISPTDAHDRTKNVEGRNDPFGLIPVGPIITIKPTAPKASTPAPKASTPPQPTIRSEPPLPPPPPQPVLAQGVTVTGLIQVGDVTKIIVKAPDEKYSRYVESGQYLSNGQVLVKRIETEGSNPMVVLEQLGIEVIKQVGNKAV